MTTQRQEEAAASTPTTTLSSPSIAAISGQSIVTVDLRLTPENDFVPESLFDTSGRLSFVLGWGNYLPGVHALLEGKTVGEHFEGVSIDAGWGERRKELIVTVPKRKLLGSHGLDDESSLKVGTTLQLNSNSSNGGGGGLQVLVTAVDEDTVTVDANPPLAGASYKCDATILAIDSVPSPTTTPPSSKYQVATFALGCFWGVELACTRLPGVVGTKAGYTQGLTVAPTYQQVSSGKTRHREAVFVVYNSEEVSYSELVDLALERLAITTPTTMFSNLFEEEDDSYQYSHGFYYHSESQRQIALSKLDKNNRFRVEVRAATTFYDAEEEHQQYLLKGGQSARKGAKESIRCFG